MTDSRRVAEFRADRPDWSSIPDELVVDSLAFRMWRLNREVEALGPIAAASLGLTRQLDRLDRAITSARDSAIERYDRIT